MPGAEVCNHSGENVSEAIIRDLETLVSGIKNLRRDMRNVMLLIEGEKPMTSQVSFTGPQLQLIMWQGEKRKAMLEELLDVLQKKFSLGNS